MPESSTVKKGIRAGEIAPEFISEIRALLPSEAIVEDEASIRALLHAHEHVSEQDDLPPKIIVLPDSKEQVSAILRTAQCWKIAVYTRGRGTGLGQLSTVGGLGVLLLTDRLNRIRVVNPVGHYAVVEAGVVNAQINYEVKQYGLFYAPDPASSKFSSIGGNVGTNAGGFKCAKYGVTRGSLLSLTVVLANGDIIETGKPVLKNVAGFDLTSLFTGSEGLLGVVVDATVRLRPIAGQERTVIAFFGDLQGAGLAIEGVLATAVQPAALELMAVPFEQTYSNKFVAAVGEAQWMLIARTDGYGADAELKMLAERLREYTQSVILPSESEAESFFIIRDTGRAFPRDSAWVASSDVGVPLDRLPQTFTKLESLAASREAKLIIMAHVADGNLHTGFVLKKTEAESKFPQTLDEARREFIEFVLGVGGTVTGEHGVGRELKEFLPAQLGTANLDLQKTLKKALDPNGILNPGKWV